MKKLLALTAVILFLANNAHGATYSGAWNQNSDDVHTIDLNPVPHSNFYVGVYDWNNSGTFMDVLNDGSYEMETITFAQAESGNWTITHNDTGNFINIGSTTDFGFYFRNASTTSYSYDLLNTGHDAWNLTNTDLNWTVGVFDANPVPIPSAVWMLGSGLAGLVGLRRRKKA